MTRTTTSMVDALSKSAVPTLRAWVDDHRATVESVVAGAVDATQENVALAEEVDFTLPTPLAFGTVSDLQDDGLTDEQRKRALAWLKKRADRTEGAFDAEEARIALALIPGWRSEILPGGMATTYPDPENYSYTHDGKDRNFWVDADTAARYTVLPKDKRGRDMPPGLYAEKVEPVSPILLTNTVMRRAWGRGLEEVSLDKPVAAVQTEDGPVELAQNWHFVPYAGTTLYLVVKPVLVAPSSKAALRVTNAQGRTAVVSGKAAWTALYGERSWVSGKGRVNEGGLGLQEAAKATVDALARKVEAREAFAKSQQGWGGALCPVCFQRAAVTPTSRHMVDHRHTRPGWGYNVAPCDGNRFPPYKESPEGSKYKLGNLRNAFDTRVATLRDTLTHPEKQEYTVKVYVKDTRGSPVYDYVTVEDRYGNEVTKHVRREKSITVRQGHPLFRDLYAKDVKAQRMHILAIADAIPFYAAAVRVWKPGLDDMAPIYAGMRREADKPALPADLFPATWSA